MAHTNYRRRNPLPKIQHPWRNLPVGASKYWQRLAWKSERQKTRRCIHFMRTDMLIGNVRRHIRYDWW